MAFPYQKLDSPNPEVGKHEANQASFETADLLLLHYDVLAGPEDLDRAH